MIETDFCSAVTSAQVEGRPLVALESTIIAHGMPYPENVHTARELEQIVREEGAEPATIAVIDGRVKIGLEEDQLEFLGKHPEIMKASRRDLGYVLSQGKSAATTVATTMILAHRAGIQVFATGGIGGVHRQAQETFDISADLQELAHTPVAVVSAGAKAILDLGLTLEYLETMGVPVVGYGTDEFPAFYTRSSDRPVPMRLDDPQAVADLLQTHWELPLRSGVLIANPIPVPYSLDPSHIELAITKALGEAESQGISGKGLTPFLLSRIEDFTEGQSLFSNIELVKSNARLAGQVAVALATNA